MRIIEFDFDIFWLLFNCIYFLFSFIISIKKNCDNNREKSLQKWN